MEGLFSKVIQILSHNGALYVLCEDGTVWCLLKNKGWDQIV